MYLERIPAAVGDAAVVEPVSVARVKRHLRIDLVDADLDADLASLITVARLEAEDRTRTTLLSRQRWRLTLDAWPDALNLPRPPLLQVEQVNYLDTAGAWQELVPAAMRTIGARLLPALGASWPAVSHDEGSIIIDYTAGYAADAAVPAPLCQWILLAIGDLDSTRERSSDKPALPQDFADSLLEPYKVWP